MLLWISKCMNLPSEKDCTNLTYMEGARRKPSLSKKNIGARLKFANEYLGKYQDFWSNVL